MQNQRSLLSQVKPTLVKQIILNQEKITNPILYLHEKSQQHVKKYDNVTVILEVSMVKDLKRWKLSNDKQTVIVKSFRETKTSQMH